MRGRGDMMKLLIYKALRLIRFRHIIKAYMRNFRRKYQTLYFDLDYKKNALAKAQKLIKTDDKIKNIQIFETKKGYHFYINFVEKITFSRAILLMTRLSVDKAYIKRFVFRGQTALFYYRRGQENEKYIYTLKKIKIKGAKNGKTYTNKI